MELGSHSELDCLLLQVSTAGPSDSVTVSHSRCKSMLLSTQVAAHWRRPHLFEHCCSGGG